MRELILRFTEDPEWQPSVSQDITDAIHAALADVNADPELRAGTYASTDSVLRLIVDLLRTGRPPGEAVPPPGALVLPTDSSGDLLVGGRPARQR